MYQHVEPELQWRAFLTNCEALTREVLPACSRKAGEQVTAAYCIVDLKGFGYGQKVIHGCGLLMDGFYQLEPVLANQRPRQGFLSGIAGLLP